MTLTITWTVVSFEKNPSYMYFNETCIMVFILNTVLVKTQKLSEALFPQEIQLKMYPKTKWVWTTFFLFSGSLGYPRMSHFDVKEKAE